MEKWTLLTVLLIVCLILLFSLLHKKSLLIIDIEAEYPPANSKNCKNFGKLINFKDTNGVQSLCNDRKLCGLSSVYPPQGATNWRGYTGAGYPQDYDYPRDGCDLARLNTGRVSDLALGSPLDPTTLTYPELIGYFNDSNPQTAYSPNEMSAMRSRDGLIHAGWINGVSPGRVLCGSDRYNTGYKYQVGSSIQTV